MSMWLFIYIYISSFHAVTIDRITSYDLVLGRCALFEFTHTFAYFSSIFGPFITRGPLSECFVQKGKCPPLCRFCTQSQSNASWSHLPAAIKRYVIGRNENLYIFIFCWCALWNIFFFLNLAWIDNIHTVYLHSFFISIHFNYNFHKTFPLNCIYVFDLATIPRNSKCHYFLSARHLSAFK